MLKNNWISNIVLIVYCFLLREVLTPATLIFVALGIALTFLNIRTGKVIRNILALGVFASYWITYGKFIDPEIGLNFLTSIIVIKIMEKDTLRDNYMIFFGLLLIISAGSLFERNLTYVFFFIASFIVLISDFYATLGQKLKFRALIWTVPLTFLLFFFVPRLLNPIPFQSHDSGPGEIGYTPEVNISEIESLSGSQSVVFHVLVNRQVKQEDLYWRGNTLSFNDGWNWPVMIQDRQSGNKRPNMTPVGHEITQSFRLFIKPEYFFALDFPRAYSYGKEYFGLKNTRTMTQRRWRGVQRYNALSDPRLPVTEQFPEKRFLQTGLKANEKENINNLFSGTSLTEVQTSIRRHFLKNQFSYSLNPGRSRSLHEFLQKKNGFCSHYASAVALILRVKGIPTRLVSGFMGGQYNRFAGFYLVSQNDAHVWVEAFSEGQWVRLDPTAWIAPERVQLGGEAFMETVAESMGRGNLGLKLPPFLNDIKMWFEQWDFMFYQWLEEMDYHTQDAWLSKLKLKREWLFTLIPLILITFSLLYYGYLHLQKERISESPYQELWRSFISRMKKRNVTLSPHSINLSEAEIIKHQDENILDIWKELLAISFRNKKISKDIKRRINKL